MNEQNLPSTASNHLRHQFKELQQRASKDALSGLLNRDTMEHCIKKRLAAMGPEDSCALFIVDLDDFKKVNDTLGHQGGDQAIRKSAQILSRIFSANDIVGRLGGDEFAIFLCGQITEQSVREKGAKICENLQLSLGNFPSVNLTASVGIYFTGKGQQFDGIYQSADLALYKAKKSGKHRFCLKSRDRYQMRREEDFRPVNTIPLSSLLEHMDSGVALLEMGEYPKIIYVSPSFCRIIGADPQSFHLPQPLSSLIHPDDQLSLEQTLRDGLRKKKVVEHTHRVSSGNKQQWFWWHIRAVHIDYDNPYPVMLVTTTDVSRFKESEQKLKQINRRLQAAFEQTDKQLWEVDISAKTFLSFRQGQKSQGFEYSGAIFPEQLIRDGWVHPASADQFREFAFELLKGQSRGYGNFILRYPKTDCYHWATLSYRMLFDDTGRAVRAVGIVEDLPVSYPKSNTVQPIPEGLLPDLMMRMEANLTEDIINDLWIEGKILNRQIQKISCSKILAREGSRLRFEEDKEILSSFFDRDALLKAFQEGRHFLYAEYCRPDESGNIRRIRHILHMVEEPVTKKIFLHAYLIRMKLPPSWEQIVGSGSGQNIITDFYKPDIIKKLGDATVGCHGGKERAVALFQIRGICEKWPETNPAPEQIYQEVTASLSIALGGGCVLSRYSPEQIVVLFPSVSSREELRRLMEEGAAFVRNMLTGSMPLSSLRFITGIAMGRTKNESFSSLLARASYVCSLWWNAAEDTVAFSSEENDPHWTYLQSDDPENRINVLSQKIKQPLSETERDWAFRCMSAMLRADSLETSMKDVLHIIGSYYQADRVYLLTLAQNQRIVTMPFEWTAPNKSRIQQVVSGMKLEHFPLLKKCIAEKAPVSLTRTMPLLPKEDSSSHKSWYFTSCPMIQNDQPEGFFCIENPRKHGTDTALVEMLIPYILREQERFHKKTGARHQLTDLSQLSDLRSFMETAYTLNSQQYSSLGAVCLDIPSIASINGSLGFEYGNTLLLYVTKTLSEIFGTSLLFRTWEAEFIAFCPNTTRQVFSGRCARLRSILNRRYSREIHIGWVWSDGKFNGKALADRARQNMRSGRTGSFPHIQLPFLEQEDYSAIGKAAETGRFTVYFQPKIHMKNGSLFGAEALVRGVGEDGSIISPSRFISALEEQGDIRELDFFVLEQTLSQIHKWKEEGLGILPVSINLSRVTLLHPSTLASILAIQSRYPDIPANALELEITERASDIKTDEFQEITNRFRSCGLRLSLDDFGSQYANLPLFVNVKFDTVKLDRSLITELVNNPINQMLIRDIVQICRARDTVCVAEGVETEEQIAALLDAGCSYAQGYYYDKPMPAAQFLDKYLHSPQQPKSPT